MKLRIIDDKGKEKVLNVRFWSFFKCNLWVELALAGIIYGAFVILWILFIMSIALMGAH